MISVGLAILLIWLAVKDLDSQNIANIKMAFRDAGYFWILLSMALASVSHVSRCVRWNILLEPLGYKPKLLNTFFALMIGYTANFAIPRLGEVSRCSVLTKYEGVPFTEAIGTVITERIIDLICIIIIFVATLAIQYERLWDFSNKTIITPITEKLKVIFGDDLYLSLFSSIMIALTIWFVLHKKKTGKKNESNKILDIAKGLWNGLKSVKEIKKPFWFIFHTLLIWVFYIESLQVALYCFDETGGLGLFASVTALIFSTLGVIVTPGGTGASQIFVTNALTTIFKVSHTFAFALSWLMWAAQFVTLVGLGVISLIFLPLYNKESDN